MKKLFISFILILATCGMAGAFGFDGGGGGGRDSRLSSTALTYSVKTSGGDFTTLHDALAAVRTKVLVPGVQPTINLDAGVWTETSRLAGVDNTNVNIVGATPVTKSMTSVQSSSGSTGAWTIILNLDTVDNITANVDYVIISSPSGGTNPTYVAGVFPVTNVDAVNSRITITSTHHAATAPSGNVAATVTVIKTIISFPNQTTGFQAWGRQFITPSNLVVAGTDITHGSGFDIQDNSGIYSGGNLGITGFQTGILLLYASQFNSTGIVAISNTTTGIQAKYGANVGTTINVNGCVDGLRADDGGSISAAPTSISTGNSNDGYLTTIGGLIEAASTIATGNAIGYDYSRGGFIDSVTATVANNSNVNYAYTTNILFDDSTRPKTVTWDHTSPYDNFNIFAQGSAAGWRGQINLETSYSGSATPVTGLSVTSQSDNTVEVSSVPAQITAGSGTGLTVNRLGSLQRQVYKVTLTYAGLSAGAKTADHVIATLPAKTRLVGIIADTITPYTGGGESAATLIVGKTTGGNEYIVSHNVFAGATTKGLADADLGTALARATAIQGGDLPSWTTTTAVSVRLTTTTNNTSGLTAGSTTYYLTTEVMP